jgi:hypothetical protein
MRLAEQGCKGNDQDLFTEVVANVQDPASPVFRAGCCDERPYDKFGIVARFGQIATSAPRRSINTPSALE